MIYVPERELATEMIPKEYDSDGVSVSGYIPKAENFVSRVVKPFPNELLIPEIEWPERLKEMQTKQLLMSDIINRATEKYNIHWLNQNPTNYCWCYAVVHAVMILRIWANEPYKRLAPASAACIIKNYRNIGGWGSQALDHIAVHGVADEEHWPQPTAMRAITEGRQYEESSRANALEHRILEWWDVKTLEAKMSCLFRHIPVPCGYLHMGHEMCSIDPHWSDAKGWGSLDLDSYARNDGKYNSQILYGKKAVGDDMVAPAVTCTIQ